MASEDRQLKELADEQGVDLDVVRMLLTTVRARAGADRFYVFWTSGAQAKPPGAQRQRTVLAFLTPDAALAFAQHNQVGSLDRPRLRRLSTFHLVQAALREPAITALLFVADLDDQFPPAGQLPHGVRVERADLLQWLHREA